MLHKVLVPRGLRHYALAAAVLRLVRIGSYALNVAKVRHGNGHVLFLNDIVQVNIVRRGGNLRAPGVGIAAPYFQYFVAYYAAQLVFVGQYAFIIGGGLGQFRMLVVYLVPLESGQPCKAHIQYRLRLLFAQSEAFAQCRLSLRRVRAALYNLNNLVYIVQRYHQAFQYVQPFPCLIKVVLRAARYHVLLEAHIMIQHFPKVKHLGFAVHKAKHYHPERILHLGMLIKLIQHNVCVNVALEIDYYPKALAVARVAQIAYALYAFFMHKLGYFFNQPCLVHLIRYFRYNYAAFAVARFLYFRARAHQYAPAARAVRLAYACVAHYYAARGEVRPGQIAHKLFNRYFGIIEHGDICIYCFAQIMRRDVRGHAYGYAAGAVHKKVWIAAGQHLGLHERFVEVRHEIDRVFAYVGHHFVRQLGHSGFGISHCGRAVAIHAAKVALAFNEHIAAVEILRKPYHCIVNAGIAVRMVFTEHIAHNTRAFMERLIGREALLVH